MNDELTPDEFIQRTNSGELWQLLDVRESWEIETASVAGAICIPMGEIPQRRGELDEKVPVAVICHSGVRSARVVSYLSATGFVQVANVTGGIDLWAQTVDTNMARY
jgi:rhodanese-related sulfurtransferase